MSLINQMLTDLEARDIPVGRPKKLVFEDLRPARRRRRRARPGILILLFLVIAVAGAVYAWGERETELRQLYQQAYQWVTALPVVAARSARQKADASMEPVVVMVPPPKPESKSAQKPVPAAAKKSPPAKPIIPAVKPRPRPAVPMVAAANRDAATRKPESVKDGVMDKKVRPLTQEEQAENTYRAAIIALKQRMPGVGEAELRSALSYNPAHVKARELLASVLLESGRWLEAQQLLEQGIEKAPEYYPFAQLLARLYVEHGAEQKALSTLEQVRSSAQKDPEFLAFLATLYQRSGRHADAVQGYRQALSLRPQEGKWWAGLGISLEAEKTWSAAAEAYRHARESGTLNSTLTGYVDQRLAQLKNRLDY